MSNPLPKRRTVCRAEAAHGVPSPRARCAEPSNLRAWCAEPSGYRGLRAGWKPRKRWRATACLDAVSAPRRVLVECWFVVACLGCDSSTCAVMVCPRCGARQRWPTRASEAAWGLDRSPLSRGCSGAFAVWCGVVRDGRRQALRGARQRSVWGWLGRANFRSL